MNFLFVSDFWRKYSKLFNWILAECSAVCDHKTMYVVKIISFSPRIFTILVLYCVTIVWNLIGAVIESSGS